MKITREFTINEVPCAIAYNEQKYYLVSFTDQKRTETKEVKYLFPVKKYSETTNSIAFDVANLHFSKLL